MFYTVTGGFLKYGYTMSYVWALIYLLSLVWWAATAKQTLLTIYKWRFLLLLPLVAALSVLWSTEPSRTATSAFQFIISTILAIRIATTLTRVQIIYALFAGLALGVFLSIISPVVPAFQPIFEPNGAFIGVYVQKTVAGVSFALSALAALAVGAMLGQRFLAFLWSIMVLPMIVLAVSVSALLVYAFVPVLLLQNFLGRFSATFRIGLIIWMVFLIGGITSVLWLDEFDLSEEFLLAIGKSPTLTGRTDIWQIGLEVWSDAPILGVGFQAFWLNPEFSEYVGFLHSTIDPRLNGFHNMFIEALVTTGLVGFFVATLTYLWTFIRCALWYISAGTMDALIWTVLITIGLSLALTDNVLFAQHETFHILSCMAFIIAAPRDV